MLGGRRMERRDYKLNQPVDLTPVPSGLLAQLLLNRFAGRNSAERKQG